MKRLRPRLFTIICFFSLILCILILLTWRKSYTAPTAFTPTTEPMRSVLAHQVPPLRLTTPGVGLSLGDSIEYLAYYTRDIVRYEIDWPSLQAAGITKSTPIGLNLPPLPLGDALAKLTTPLGPAIRFTTSDNVIRFSTINSRNQPSGIQYIPPTKFDDYFRVVARSLISPKPPPKILPLYERVIANQRLTLTANNGAFRLWLTPQDPASIYQSTLHSSTARPLPRNLSNPMFQFHRDRAFQIYFIGLPFWSLAALSAFLPLIWLLKRLHRLRLRRRNICTQCGYDLRATPTLCPECGFTPQHP